MRVGSPTGLAFCALLASALAGGASAATIAVNSTDNTTVDADGKCTLREAVLNANGDIDTTGGDCLPGSGPDVVTVIAGTFNLSTPLAVSDDLTLQGVSAAQTIV